MPTSAALVLALLDLFPSLKTSLSDRYEDFLDEFLMLAATLEHQGDIPSLAGDLNAYLARLLQAVGRDSQRVQLQLAAVVAGAEGPPRGPAGSPAPATATRKKSSAMGGEAKVQPQSTGAGERQPAGESEKLKEKALPDGVVEVRVHYGTDRVSTDKKGPAEFYGGKRTEVVRYGIARVTVPTKGREVGELPGKRWYQFRVDPAEHVVHAGIEEQGRDIFIQTLRAELKEATEKDALLFVHGYNVTFTDAARRAAQMSVDLKFNGATLLYSWASVGSPGLKSYTTDEGTIREISARNFQEFLRMALTELGAARVHVIAHSMGNRALVSSLEHFEWVTLPKTAAKLAQVIFAAPDVPKDEFKVVAAKFKGRATRYTLYASSNDLALKASKSIINTYARAGDASPPLTIVDGVDTIDASEADTSLIGLRHSYFANKRSILNDIADVLLALDYPKRFQLQPAGGPPPTHHEYRR